MSLKAEISGNPMVVNITVNITSASIPSAEYLHSFNLDDFLSSIPVKSLFKTGFIGNSIIGRPLGGGNFDEPTGEKPHRGGYNTIPRRIYDNIITNFSAPYYRRIDHADWTRSILSGSDDFTEITGNEILNPDWTNAANGTLYAYCQEPNGYAEINIPDGYENFVIILHKDNNEFAQDYDDNLTVTLNGGDISGYGAGSIDSYKVKSGAGDYGNPFYTELYEGLPAGINTIRIKKSNTNKTLMMWGIVYWTGNTSLMFNHGISGYDMQQYYDYTNDSIIENNYDAIFFEMPGMNEASGNNTINQIQSALSDFITLLDNKDVLYLSTHPFGDNGAGTNYYTLYNNPTLKEVYYWCRDLLYNNNKPFLNVFKRFEDLIVADGGTLEGGEGGLTYTTDGQHPNILCSGIFADYIIDKAIGDKL
jgi:hypothetical protein